MAGVAIYISVQKNTHREINNIKFSYFFHGHSYTTAMVAVKQISVY